MSISIFAKPSFLRNDPELNGQPVLTWTTSCIRGEQIAEYIGAKYNPKSGYEDDLCIHLRPRTLDYIKDNDYVDVSDGAFNIVEQLQSRPKIKVIASYPCSYKFMKERLKNEVVYVPEHHCNFERAVRERKEVTTGGVINNPSVHTYSVYDEIKKRLENIGLKFITCFHYKNRQDVVDFYKQIDFQIIDRFERPTDNNYNNDYNPFIHPSKIINAGSFGIPTIASWKLGFDDFSYIPVKTIDALMEEVEKIRDENNYNQWPDKLIKEAEKYHISKIAEIYKQLEVRH